MSNGDQFDNPPAPPETVVVADLFQSEVDPRKKAQLETLGQQDAGWFTTIWAAFWAGVFDGIGVIVSTIAGALDTVMSFMGRFFLLGQGQNNSAFYDLSAAVLEDLTGVKVDSALLKQSAFGGGPLLAAQAFGRDLYNLLASEFAPKSGNLETPDNAPAQAFLGFLMNFAIRQGNIEVLTSLLPESIRFAEGFRSYGELMAKNLGLGRMARRAFQPLIQTLVADPLQFQLNAQYTPKRLAVEQTIRAFFRENLTDVQLAAELSQQGYSAARQASMIADLRTILSDREVVHLFLRNVMDKDTMTKELQHRGWASTDINLVLDIERPQLDKTEILDLYIFGQIARSDASTALLLAGYNSGDAENLIVLAEMKAQIVHPKHPLKGKRQSVAQLHREYIEGVINLSQWNDSLTAIGYNADDIATLTQDLLLAAAKAPKGTKTAAIPKLTIAQLKAAYAAQILTIADVTQHLEARGYSQADINTLLAVDFPPQTPPAAPVA